MATNDFLPFGIAAGANVMSQADYLVLASRANGFSSGTAASAQLNKAWRQSSVMGSVLAQFISNQADVDVLDNGNTTPILNNLTLAVKNAANSYSRGEVNTLLSAKVSRDSILSAGFRNNDVTLPYFLRESDSGVYFLEPKIGYTTVQQGGGIGQLPNKIKIGYSLQGVRITVDTTDAGVIWTSTNFDPASKADAGSVSQATESARGTARIATIGDVNAGVDDAAFVTSKKLRWGFSASLAINGYIALPSWLGGLVIQWGRYDPAGSQFGNVAFPVAFPNNGFIALAVDTVHAGNPHSLSVVGVTVPTTAGFSLVLSSALAGGPQMWAAIGN